MLGKSFAVFFAKTHPLSRVGLAPQLVVNVAEKQQTDTGIAVETLYQELCADLRRMRNTHIGQQQGLFLHGVWC